MRTARAARVVKKREGDEDGKGGEGDEKRKGSEGTTPQLHQSI